MPVSDSKISRRWHRVKEFIDSCANVNLWVDIKRHAPLSLKGYYANLVCMSQEMVEYTKTLRYQRTDSRLGCRNGCYYRNLGIELGPIDKLVNAEKPFLSADLPR